MPPALGSVGEAPDGVNIRVRFAHQFVLVDLDDMMLNTHIASSSPGPNWASCHTVPMLVDKVSAYRLRRPAAHPPPEIHPRSSAFSLKSRWQK